MKVRYLMLFILLGCSTLFFQCTKDKMKSPYECIEHERLTDMLGQSIFHITYPLNEMAYFNPNNSNEIIYRHGDGITPEFDLIKYNLRTKEKEVIYTGSFSNRPRWGKNDWILLNIWDSLGFNVYKMKSSGDSLTALTTGSHCFNPEWNILSNKFMYELGFTNPTEYIISDSDGNSHDTVFVGASSMGSWQSNELIVNGTFKGLFLGNPILNDNELIYETENLSQSLNGAEWLDEERVFWCHTTEIYITNIRTKETEVIRETCNALCFQRPTYATDIDKIIVEKLERIKKEDEETGIIKVTLVMMNPDGTEEEIIELD